MILKLFRKKAGYWESRAFSAECSKELLSYFEILNFILQCCRAITRHPVQLSNDKTIGDNELAREMSAILLKVTTSITSDFPALCFHLTDSFILMLFGIHT